MNDKELIKQIQSGRKELLNEVIKKYYDDVLRFCIYELHDTGAAYDLAQDTFLRFIMYVDHYRFRNLKAYLITIARNLCVDYWRREKKNFSLEEREERGYPEDFETQKAGNESHGDKSLRQIEQRIDLMELLGRIPVEQREVVVLRYYCDFKLTEIAEILHIPLSTVKSRLRLGLIRLNTYGGGDDADE